MLILYTNLAKNYLRLVQSVRVLRMHDQLDNVRLLHPLPCSYELSLVLSDIFIFMANHQIWKFDIIGYFLIFE